MAVSAVLYNISYLSINLFPALDPTKAGNAFKRPVAVRRKDLQGQDRKYDLVYVMQHFRQVPLICFLISPVSLLQCSASITSDAFLSI